MRSGKPVPLRILNYAVNGLGLGHLTRLIAINRQIRRLATLSGIPTEILFLTSNEGDSLAYQHGFASFKIPSKSAVAACGLDPVRYRKIAKQWVWNAINLCSPDILIVDTFPAGSFQELFDILDLGSKNVFIYRAVRAEAGAQPAFQSALRGYDLILLPQEQGENDSPVPEALQDRVVPTQEILIRSASEVLSRSEARAMLGLPVDSLAVYFSVGGGGDAAAEAAFATAIQIANQMPEVRFVIGAGALYRGREFPAPNVTWTRRSIMMEYFSAFDAAVAAGGYNSVWELMHCGVPCVFLPQPRTHDDQERRVERCVAAGAGVLPADRTPEAIVAALQKLLQPEVRTHASQAAKALVPVNDALTAAEEILALAADRITLEENAALLSESEFLDAARKAEVDEGLFLSMAHFYVRASAGRYDADEIASATVNYLQVSEKEGVSSSRAMNALRRAIRKGVTSSEERSSDEGVDALSGLTEQALALLKE